MFYNMFPIEMLIMKMQRWWSTSFPLLQQGPPETQGPFERFVPNKRSCHYLWMYFPRVI